MELEICSDGGTIRAEISGQAGRRNVLLTNRGVEIDWVRLPDGRYSILVDGRVYDLVAELEGESCLVEGRQGRAVLQIRDPRRLSTERVADEGQAGLQRLNAEMPGKVIRVLVKEGDTVAYEQGLIVVEAMKMQNEIRATKAGTVKSIGVAAGKTVSTGDFLLSIE